VREFITTLALARKGMNEIKILTEKASGNTGLKKKQLYQIIKEVKDEQT
jgi:hypothetical protein